LIRFFFFLVTLGRADSRPYFSRSSGRLTPPLRASRTWATSSRSRPDSLHRPFPGRLIAPLDPRPPGLVIRIDNRRPFPFSSHCPRPHSLSSFLTKKHRKLKNLESRLITSPDRRMSVEQIKKHPFFYGVDWLAIRNIEAPFIPRLRSITDTSYFPTDELDQVPDEPVGGDTTGAHKDLAFLGYVLSSRVFGVRETDVEGGSFLCRAVIRSRGSRILRTLSDLSDGTRGLSTHPTSLAVACALVEGGHFLASSNRFILWFAIAHATAGWVRALRVPLFGSLPDTSPFHSLLMSTKCYRMIPFPPVFSLLPPSPTRCNKNVVEQMETQK